MAVRSTAGSGGARQCDPPDHRPTRRRAPRRHAGTRPAATADRGPARAREQRIRRPPPHPATRRVAMRAQGPRLRGAEICATPCDKHDRGVAHRRGCHSVPPATASVAAAPVAAGGAEHRRVGRGAATIRRTTTPPGDAARRPRPQVPRLQLHRHARVDVRVAAALVAAWRCGAPPGRAGRGNAIRPTPPHPATRRVAMRAQGPRLRGSGTPTPWNTDARTHRRATHRGADVRVPPVAASVAAALVAAWRCGAPPGRVGRGNAIPPDHRPTRRRAASPCGHKARGYADRGSARRRASNATAPWHRRGCHPHARHSVCSRGACRRMAVRSTAGSGGARQFDSPDHHPTRRRAASPCGHEARGYADGTARRRVSDAETARRRQHQHVKTSTRPPSTKTTSPVV